MIKDKSKALGVQLTKRDMEIIQFINEFGFCEMPHIEKRFLLKKPRSYQIMQRLVQLGLVVHERIFYAQHGVYYLSVKGANYTELPSIEKVPIGIYEHQLLVIDVSMRLQQQFPKAHWVSERRLKQDKFQDGLGQYGHVADGLLVFPEGKQIAIEVELTVKGKNRIERILKRYSAQFGITEVWYYCGDKVIPVLSVFAEKMPFLKIYSLKEFLS